MAQANNNLKFYLACRAGNVADVEKLIGSVDINWKSPQNDHNTALHVVCLTKRLEVLQLLVKQDALDATLVNKFNITPLWYACAVGWQEGVLELLTSNLNLNEEAKCEEAVDDWKGTTPLEIAERKHPIPLNRQQKASFPEIAALVRAYQEQLAQYLTNTQPIPNPPATPIRPRSGEEEEEEKKDKDKESSAKRFKQTPNPREEEFWKQFGDDTLKAQYENLKKSLAEEEPQQQSQEFQAAMQAADTACKNILKGTLIGLMVLFLGRSDVENPKYSLQNPANPLVQVLMGGMRGEGREHFVERVVAEASSKISTPALVKQAATVLAGFYLKDPNVQTSFGTESTVFPSITFKGVELPAL